ncbi:hypothetical protein Q7P35_012063 [Cladosporium inversicolor]
MSNPNNQPTDLRGMVRTRRRSNNRHTTLSAREGPSSRFRDYGPWTAVTTPPELPVTQSNTLQPRDPELVNPNPARQPWTFTPPAAQPIPQTKTVQPRHPEAVNHNPAGAPPTSFLQQPANQPTTAPTSTNNNNNNNIVIPIFTQPHPTNNPVTPTPSTISNPEAQQQPPPKPHLQPSSPARSITSANLEDIDLRSPADDPDYDFIDVAEAMHSARNAQPDRADKYPEQNKGAKLGSASVDGGEEVKAAEAKKKQGRGWFSFLK